MSIQTAHDLRALGDGFGKIIDRGDEPQGSVLGLLRDAKDTIFAAADRLLALEMNAPENDPEFQKSVAEPAPAPEPEPPPPPPPAEPAPEPQPEPEAAPVKSKGGGKDRVER